MLVRTTYILGFLFIGYFAIAQKAGDDFGKVKSAYDAAGPISMNVEYVLYEDYTTTVSYDKQLGTYSKSGASSITSLSGIETLINEKYLVVCDHNDKMILVGDPAPSKNPALVNTDSLLKICSSVKFSENAAGQKVYRLEFEKTQLSEYSVMGIYISKQTSFIEKVTLYYRFEAKLGEERNSPMTKPRLEIVYKNIKARVVFPLGFFSEKKFITCSGKAMACSSTLVSYKLINQKLTQ